MKALDRLKEDSTFQKTGCEVRYEAMISYDLLIVRAG